MPQRNLTHILRRRLIYYAAGALLLMALAAGLTVSVPLIAQRKVLEENSLLQAATLKAQATSEWLRQNRHVARQIAARTGMRQELELLNKGLKPAQEVIPFITGAILDALRQSSDVLGITRLNDKGQPVAQGGLPIPPELLRQAQGNTDRVLISLPQILDGRQCLLFSAPIRNRSNEYIGCDVMAVSTQALRQLLGPDALLGLWQDNAPLWFWPRHDNQPPPGPWHKALVQAVNKDNGVQHADRMVLAHVAVPDSPWGLLLEADRASLYAPIRASVWGVAGYMALVYVLCLGGFIFVSRPLAGTILLHTHELEATIDAKTRQLQDQLHARILAEKSLQKIRDELERRVEKRTRSLAEANEALRHEQAQRKQVARELINLLEGVRSDISRDLHDHTGQLLTTLRLSLETLRGEMESHAPQEALRLQQAGESVKNIQRTLKGIARGLRPPCLDYLGLVAALEVLLEEYRQTGLKIFFFHKDIPETLEAERGLALYRIAQEALTNVLRHAKAATVHVSFTCQRGPDARTVTLSIEDDGQGFDAAHMLHARGPVERLGLTLMQERMVLLGGECVVESAPGRGTQIMAQMTIPGAGAVAATDTTANTDIHKAEAADTHSPPTEAPSEDGAQDPAPKPTEVA